MISIIIVSLNTKNDFIKSLKSAISQLIENQVPAYEIISGAAITFAALLLIIPGFATDVVGFILIFPFTRKLILRKFTNKFKKQNKRKDFIEGTYEDIEDEDDRKI